MLRLVYPDGLHGKSIVDIGCRAGGYSTEFARLGMIATGIEVRQFNYRNCLRVKAGTDLPTCRTSRSSGMTRSISADTDPSMPSSLLGCYITWTGPHNSWPTPRKSAGA